MSKWNEVARFMYSDVLKKEEGFWYSRPLFEIEGLTEEQLFWVPNPKGLSILWHVGHIAHRERSHIGIFLQGLQPTIIPSEFGVFGTDWVSVEEIRKSIKSVPSVFNWVQEVRKSSQDYIATLQEDDFHKVLPTSFNLSVSHWLFITAAHTSLHLGRIQLLRALIEDKPERAC